jgi:hypothetical protein
MLSWVYKIGLVLKSFALKKSKKKSLKSNMEAKKVEKEQPGTVIAQRLQTLVDPITLEPIQDDRLIKLNSNAFDIVSLITYFVRTSDFRDPLSGIHLTEDQIINLDMQSFSFLMRLHNGKDAAAALVLKPGTGSLSQSKASLGSSEEDRLAVIGVGAEAGSDADVEAEAEPAASTSFSFSSKADGKELCKASSESIDIVLPPLLPLFRRCASDGSVKKRQKETLQSLDAIIGELVSDMYNLLESDRSAKQEDFNYAVLRIVSELDYPFAELKSLDPAYAYLSLQGFKSFLRGSKERPTIDPNRRLSYIMSILDRTLLTDADHARHSRDRRERSQSYDCQLPASNSSSSPRTRAESA